MIKQIALDKIASLAWTVEEWNNVYRAAPEGSALEQIALDSVVALALAQAYDG